jgi:hypothetical protein
LGFCWVFIARLFLGSKHRILESQGKFDKANIATDFGFFFQSDMIETSQNTKTILLIRLRRYEA